MRDNEKDRALPACALWKCASITTNQASRVMKAAAAAFFIGTGAANRKRHQHEQQAETQRDHSLLLLLLMYTTCDAWELKNALCPLYRLENILIIHKRWLAGEWRLGEKAQISSPRRASCVTKWDASPLALPLPGLVFYGPEKDARLEWEDKKLVHTAFICARAS
jgi:hypothetical protein